MTEEVDKTEEWKALKEAIGRANLELEKDMFEANRKYQETIAPYKKALIEKVKKEKCTVIIK